MFAFVAFSAMRSGVLSARRPKIPARRKGPRDGAIDADRKLCISYLVGGRDLGWAKEFLEDCASRIQGRVQVTTDGHKAYLEAVEGAFGMDVDYAQLQKIYGSTFGRRDAAIFASPMHR
jgi:hypothetical protein